MFWRLLLFKRFRTFPKGHFLNVAQTFIFKKISLVHAYSLVHVKTRRIRTILDFRNLEFFCAVIIEVIFILEKHNEKRTICSYV